MTQKRFYDQEQHTSQAVELMLKFPDELQTILANSMSQIAEGDYNADQILNDLKSLGTEKVLALYKSKQKKREYDKNPSFHRAMNYMMVMPSQDRQAIAGKTLVLMSHVQEYLKVCKEKGVTPSLSSIEVIANTFVQQGPEESKKMIQEVVAQPAPVGPTVDPTLAEAIQSEEVGMRIKGELI